MSTIKKLNQELQSVQASQDTAGSVVKEVAAKLGVRVKLVSVESGWEAFGLLQSGVPAPRLSKAKAVFGSISESMRVHGREDMTHGGGFVTVVMFGSGSNVFTVSFSPDTRTISAIRV